MVSLPTWAKSVVQVWNDAFSGAWLDPPPATDPRALQDPRAPSGPRKIGQFSNNPADQATYAFDITVTPAPPGFVYQFSVYFVDYDTRGRRQTVQLMDGVTLTDISPVQTLGEDFVQGAWLVWQYSGSVRVRSNLVRGENQVISAILFDLVATT